MSSVTVTLGSIPITLENATPDANGNVNAYNMATAIGARGIEYYDGLLKQISDQLQENTAKLNAVNDLKTWNLSDFVDPTTGMQTPASAATAAARRTELQTLGLIPADTPPNVATFQYQDTDGTTHTGLSPYPPQQFSFDLPLPGELYYSTFTSPPQTLVYLRGSASVPGTIVYRPVTNVTTYVSGASVTFTYSDSIHYHNATAVMPPKLYPGTFDDTFFDATLNDPTNFGLYITSDGVLFTNVYPYSRLKATILPENFAPDAAQLAKWQSDAHEMITPLTQISQQQQAQTQDLIASYNKFLDFTSNLQERKERNLMSVIDHF
jgi:hypothetical protein